MKTLFVVLIGLLTSITPEESIRNNIRKEYSSSEYNIENIIYCETVVFSNFIERIVNNLNFEKNRELRHARNDVMSSTLINNVIEKYDIKFNVVNEMIKTHLLKDSKVKIYEVVIHFISFEDTTTSFFYLLDENNNVFGIMDKSMTNAVFQNENNNFVF